MDEHNVHLAVNDGEATVVGAGPSGLTCALVLARAGISVTVREARASVGARFHGDFQGLENWSSLTDVLKELASFGIAPSFDHIPVRAGVAFDDRGTRYDVRSGVPLFYLVRRGNGEGTLDRALYQQAVAAGAQIRFGDKVDALDPRRYGVIGAGPKLPYAIAAGFVFDTAMADGCYIRLDDALAPSGYAYLLVHGGRGTVASCLFRDFRNEQQYVHRTVAAFERDAGLVMKRPRPFGGSGSFFLKGIPYQGTYPVIGEHAGLQDALFGFGMRWAMRSGAWAAKALLGLDNLEDRWRRDFRPGLAAGIVNRLLFDRMGDRWRRRGLRQLARSADPRAIMRRVYEGTALTRALAPLAAAFDRARLRDPACSHRDCSCIWCRQNVERAACCEVSA